MRALPVAATVCLALLVVAPALAAEQTVKLGISGMWCASCAYIVKRTLSKLDGVRGVEVSAREKSAVVTFEDTKASVMTLTAATAQAGFPSTVIE